MTGQPLPDQDHRDVISGHADGSLDRTVFVDAGAGTGKTTALVDRVVALLIAGVPIREIAAITFTEAAASELRHRVREAIEAALDEQPSDDVAARLRAALTDVDDAAFTTLHAFAQGILLDNPLEAQLPPELELLGDIEEAATFEERWDVWLADFASRDEIQPVLAHLDELKITIPQIRTLARTLHDQYHRVPPDLAVEPDRYDPPAPNVADVLAQLDTFARWADEADAAKPGDKLTESLRIWVAAGEPLRRAVDRGAPLGEVLAALEELRATPLHSGGAKAAWGSSERVSEVKAVRKALRDELIDAVYTPQYDHALRAMASWTACFVLEWARERKRLGQLVFQDLLVLARDVLRDDASVRARVRGRYQHLLIDEFQDTDPIQIEMAVLLAAVDHDALAGSAGPDGSVAWKDAALVPGRLFFVGDPKQSIYRFRGADIAVYEGAKAFVQQDKAQGEVRQLTHNFRSVPGVLGWVNTLFDQLLVPRESAQPAYFRLTGQRGVQPTAERVAVRWIGGPGGSAAEVREIEAADVVRTVRRLVGRQPVHDKRSDTTRPARASDIAVLVRRHATARQLERCFDDADLPLVVEARSLIFSSDEVRDLTTILTAIEDPNDEVAVVGALRHPAFGCSDADLVDWNAQGEAWWLPRPDGVRDDHPVGRALAVIADLRRQRDDRTVGGFVETVIDRLLLAELALSHTRYRDRWRRIRFVADQAHAFHEAGGHLRGFVRWLRDQADENVRRDEHVVPDTDDDAVRVTTVHAAKGLEYPIVIVLGLDTTTDRPLHDAKLLWAPDGGVELNLSKLAKTAGFGELNSGERLFHQEEEQRLLYVATTRARDLLVVSRHRSSKNNGCHAARLDDLADLLDEHWTELDLDAAASPPPPAAPTGEPGDSAADLARFVAEVAHAVSEASRPRVVAATTVASLLAGDDRDAERAQDAADAEATDALAEDDGSVPGVRPQPWRKGRSGSAVGRAVHAVLQTVDLETVGDIDAIVRAQCDAEGLDAAAVPTVMAMARRAAEAPTVRAAVEAGRYARELHVGAPVTLADGSAITLEGFIDLLVDLDDGLVVVDYKTDTVRGRSAAQVVERYTPQAATYALALEAALERPVQRCVFVLAGASSDADLEVEISGDALSAAKAALLHGLGDALTR